MSDVDRGIETVSPGPGHPAPPWIVPAGNVAGWLDFAGGLGGIVNDAQGRVGKILSPEQMKAMYDTGFEWGEYLVVDAPWEMLGAPPVKK